MENLVAVKVVDEEGTCHCFITWGRIFGAVDPEPLFQAVTPHLPGFGVHHVTSINLCSSLREASTQPYFYEALFSFAQTKIPLGDNYGAWREEQMENINREKKIYYLGRERA